jgi:transposase
MVRPCSSPATDRAGSGTEKEHAMTQKSSSAIAVVGIDIGKNSFHIVGQNQRGAIVLRQKWSRGQVEARSPICRRVGSAWRPASAHITSVAH